MMGSGPVVIWNLIRRCNLTCKHCYATSADTDFPGELDTEQVYEVMQDLRDFGVAVLILSGGETAHAARYIRYLATCKRNGVLCWPFQ